MILKWGIRQWKSFSSQISSWKSEQTNSFKIQVICSDVCCPWLKPQIERGQTNFSPQISPKPRYFLDYLMVLVKEDHTSFHFSLSGSTLCARAARQGALPPGPPVGGAGECFAFDWSQMHCCYIFCTFYICNYLKKCFTWKWGRFESERCLNKNSLFTDWKRRKFGEKKFSQFDLAACQNIVVYIHACTNIWYSCWSPLLSMSENHRLWH